MEEFVKTIVGQQILNETQTSIITATSCVLIVIAIVYIMEWVSICIFPKKWERRK